MVLILMGGDRKERGQRQWAQSLCYGAQSCCLRQGEHCLGPAKTLSEEWKFGEQGNLRQCVVLYRQQRLR